MSVSLTNVTGPIYLPNGQTPEGGRVSFELSSWDREPEEAVFVSGPVYSTIDENGNISVQLFTTTEGVNSVHYKMYVHWVDSNFTQAYENSSYNSLGSPRYIKQYIGSFALSGSGPFSLANLDIVSELQANSFDIYQEVVAYNNAIELLAEQVAENTLRAEISADEASESAAQASAFGTIYTQTDAELALMDVSDGVTLMTRLPVSSSVGQSAVIGEASYWKLVDTYVPPDPYFSTNSGTKIWVQTGYRESVVLSTLQSAISASFTEITTDTQRRLLGAVSQTGGTVTGTAFEIISNANGQAERRASGYQVATKADLSITGSATAFGALFRSSVLTWTFPAAFAAGTIPLVQINANSSDVLGVRIAAISETAVTFSVVSAVSVAGDITINASATGRWSTMT